MFDFVVFKKNSDCWNEGSKRRQWLCWPVIKVETCTSNPCASATGVTNSMALASVSHLTWDNKLSLWDILFPQSKGYACGPLSSSSQHSKRPLLMLQVSQVSLPSLVWRPHGPATALNLWQKKKWLKIN